MTEDVKQGGGRGAGWRAFAWAGFIGLVLLIPLVAMQFTSEVAWDGFDFIFAGAILSGAAAMYEFTAAKSVSLSYRIGVAVAVATAFAIVWSTGAVGIIGSEDNPANLLFGTVLGLALTGAVAARFRAEGMAWTMFATAFVQAAIGVIALVGAMGEGDPNWPYDVIGATGVFCCAWVLSGVLFRNAAA